MNKIYNKQFDETYYKEILDNGLEVLIFHKPNFISSFVGIGTNFGALNLHQKYLDKDYYFNPGVAHFLEHKLFESEEKNIFDLFSNLGCDINAFTSYNETVYYFQTTNQEIKEPLNLLLDFVQDLDINEESVEKEKGIIIQEVMMHKQEVESRLLEETYKSLYHTYPLIYDIGGSIESINSITKDELELAYSLNYHPCNMVLLVVGPNNPNEIIKTIKDNQSKKTFERKIIKPITVFEKEPLEVNRKEYSFKMNIQKAKHVYALKLKADFKDKKDCAYKERCMNILMRLYFSPFNPHYQKWLDEGIINDYFAYDVDFDMNYANILFLCESDGINLKELIDNELNEDLIDEESLNQIKRQYIGASFRPFNDIGIFGSFYIRDYLNGFDYFDILEVMKDIDVDALRQIKEDLNTDNFALIHVYPQDK